MREDDDTVEVLRRRFRNADRAQTLRHGTRDALLQVIPGAAGADWVDDVLIVVSELVQNVSQHTSGPGELIVALEPVTVLIEVGDLSTTPPQPHRPAAGAAAGGRGLLLIAAISQQWGVRTCPNGKVVWARLPAAVPPRLSVA